MTPKPPHSSPPTELESALQALTAKVGPHLHAEPPPALDAAILAAARAAVSEAAAPRSLPWWRRLRAPMALAATVMFAVLLTLTMERNPPAPDDTLTENRQAPASESAPGLPALQNSARQPASAEAKEERLRAAPKPAEAAAPMAAPAKKAKTELQAGAHAEPPAAPAAPVIIPEAAMRKDNRLSDAPMGAAQAGKLDAAGAARSTLPASPAPPQRAAPAEAESADTMMRSEAKRQAAALKSAPAAESRAPAAAYRQKAAEASVLPPEEWVKHIRELRQQGRMLEADLQLQALQKAHPNYVLPEDLRGTP